MKYILKKLHKTKAFRAAAKGYSLVEIIVSVGIFTLIIGSVSVFSIDAYRATVNTQNRITAATYLQEMSTAIELNAQDMWSTISQNTGNGNSTPILQSLNINYQK